MGRKSKGKAKARAAGLGVAKHKKKPAKLKHSVPAQQQYSVHDLMTKAEECLDSFQYELAVKFCERALQVEPGSVCVLDTYAPLLLEIGETDKAIECFKRCIELCPDEGHAKYLYVGQLTSGGEAIALLTKGIEIMSRSLVTSSEGVEDAAVMCEGVTGDELSAAYCSLAEVYLTDSCFIDDAGEECFKCCNKAVELSPSNPEAYQLMANCLLSQQKTDEARTTLMKGVALWLPSNTTEASGSHDQSEALPPYFSRVSTAKLLLELQEFEVAQQVLERLLHDDDEVVSVWYLMGWLHTLTKDADSARFYLEQAQTLYSKLGCDEQDMLEHTRQLLVELGPAEAEGEGEELTAANKDIEDEVLDEDIEQSSEDEDRTTSMDIS